jgi:hypothetical protein
MNSYRQLMSGYPQAIQDLMIKRYEESGSVSSPEELRASMERNGTPLSEEITDEVWPERKTPYAKVRAGEDSKGRRYNIEVRTTPAPGMPGGRTHSIKQVYR